MNDLNAEKLVKILEDKDFVLQLLKLEAPEDVQKAFEEKDIFFTLDEVKEIGAALTQEISSIEGDEISEENLEEVAGGFVITGITAVGIAKLVIAIAGLGLSIYGAHKAHW